MKMPFKKSVTVIAKPKKKGKKKAKKAPAMSPEMKSFATY